ncbi:MAG: hypothetical protein Fur0022_21730 [Anaerolineales bacterium]
MRTKTPFCLLILILSTLACNSALFATPTPVPTPTPIPVGTDLRSPLPPGDPVQGERLFSGQVNGQFACSSCHGVFAGQVTTCPNIVGLSAQAGARIPGYSAEQYLREAIVLPDAFVVEGYPAGVMPQNFGELMTAQQLADILAYLMTK